jgi:hypothetical protein
MYVWPANLDELNEIGITAAVITVKAEISQHQFHTRYLRASKGKAAGYFLTRSALLLTSVHYLFIIYVGLGHAVA